MRALQGVLERRPDQPGLQQRRCELVVALEEIAVERAELGPRTVNLPDGTTFEARATETLPVSPNACVYREARQ